MIGKLPVWELYEDGGARQIMRMLRSTSYGGVGRLEQTRREVRIASGEVVPVSMTASILYEREREVATVGILTDLRERIRMEQRLLDAQQKLQLSEKQALVAELAGAAAHELNQPLTSIIGSAGMIQRQSPPEAPHLRAVGVILSEAERMAGIVKKIGRITKYETIDYVGGARMLDLHRAAARERSGDRAGVRRDHRRVPGGRRGPGRRDAAAVADRRATCATSTSARTRRDAVAADRRGRARRAARSRDRAAGPPRREPALVGRALDILSRLLPGRALCVRVLDVRTGEPARTATCAARRCGRPRSASR